MASGGIAPTVPTLYSPYRSNVEEVERGGLGGGKRGGPARTKSDTVSNREYSDDDPEVDDVKLGEVREGGEGGSPIFLGKIWDGTGL